MNTLNTQPVYWIHKKFLTIIWRGVQQVYATIHLLQKQWAETDSLVSEADEERLKSDKDKLAKVRPLSDHIYTKCQLYCQPEKEW